MGPVTEVTFHLPKVNSKVLKGNYGLIVLRREFQVSYGNKE
jgi:hypothetical protein